MTPKAYLKWMLDGATVSGVTMPVSFPGIVNTTQGITITSSSNDLGTYETFYNIKFYLDGDISQVQYTWPYYGIDPNDPSGPHIKPELDGGLDISFDNGQTFTRFDTTHGNREDPSTWILLPSSAVSNGIAGKLRPFDAAKIHLKLVIPPIVTQLGLININLQADYDIK